MDFVGHGAPARSLLASRPRSRVLLELRFGKRITSPRQKSSGRGLGRPEGAHPGHLSRVGRLGRRAAPRGDAVHAMPRRLGWLQAAANPRRCGAEAPPSSPPTTGGKRLVRATCWRSSANNSGGTTRSGDLPATFRPRSGPQGVRRARQQWRSRVGEARRDGAQLVHSGQRVLIGDVRAPPDAVRWTFVSGYAVREAGDIVAFLRPASLPPRPPLLRDLRGRAPTISGTHLELSRSAAPRRRGTRAPRPPRSRRWASPHRSA